MTSVRAYPRILTPSVMGLVLLSGCMSWQTTAKQTLLGAFEATNAVSEVAERRFHDKCMEQAKACKLKEDTECKTLSACQSDREVFAAIVLKIREAVAVGLMAIQLSQQRDVEAAIGEVMGLLMQVRQLAGL